MADGPQRSKWTTLGLGCLALLAAWAALGVVCHRLMDPLKDPDFRLGLAVAASLLLTLGLSSFWSLARGFGGGPSFEAMSRRAQTGAPPEDGKPVIASGVVRALGAPLQAPLSGVPCVMYQYKMYYNSIGTRGRPSEVSVYWGYVSRPFAIEAAGGRLRVLAVPMLYRKAEERRGADAVERAQRLVRTTRFEASGAVGSVFAMASDIFTDEDGVSRRDWKRQGDDRDPAQLRLEETVLPVGELASAHGVWSQERGGLVVGDAPGSMVTVVPGPSSKLRGMVATTQSVGYYAVSATVLTSLGAGLVWFARSILPTL